MYKHLFDSILEITNLTQSYCFATLVHNQYHRSDTDSMKCKESGFEPEEFAAFLCSL